MTTTTRRAIPAAPGAPPRVWRELAIVSLLYVLYAGGRALIPLDVDLARERAADIVVWERGLGLDIEHVVNAFTTEHAPLAVAASYFYSVMHYTVTPGVLVWLWRRHPHEYSPARTVLVVATLMGLVCYLIAPTAPPRLMPDGPWVDTLAAYDHAGWWGASASAPESVAQFTNQYAAVPSLHVGWAVWCALQIAHVGRPLLAALGGLYAFTSAVVVVATGNHWVIDVAAGALVVLAAVPLSARLRAHLPRSPGHAQRMLRRPELR